MDLTMSVRKIGAFFLACALTNPCFSQGSVALEKQPWPEMKQCEVCVPIQFGRLDMLLPLGGIGKILVINSESSALHIIPKTGDPTKSVLFLTPEPKDLLKRYQKAGLLQGLGINNNERLFDALGNPAAPNATLSIIRNIHHIDEASRYTKTSKGALHVYWIQSSAPGSDYVYFVIDGDETIYLLAGDVTRIFYEAVLSNLRVVDMP